MNKQQLIDFETKVARLWEQGKIKVPVHLSGGNENELIKIFEGISRQDYVFSTHRNHYHYLLHGGKKDALLAELLGNYTKGICKGQSGSMHTISYKRRFYSSGIVAGCVSIACGVAEAIQRRGSNRKVFCFVGDGAVDEGWFWEAWRYAIGFKLPITFVIEDNDRSVTTCKETRWGTKGIMTYTLADKLIHYYYTARYPHVGSGKEIQW